MQKYSRVEQWKLAGLLSRRTQVRFLPLQLGESMTQKEIEFVKKCAKEDIHRFYTWGKWKEVRRTVLNMDKQECQLCKSRGKYSKATTVHHVNYVKKHPEKALDIFYVYHGEKKRNLISLCHDCHEEVHGYRKSKHKQPLTEERWE